MMTAKLLGSLCKRQLGFQHLSMKKLLVWDSNAFGLGSATRVPEQTTLHVVFVLEGGLEMLLEGLSLLDEGGSGCLVGVKSAEDVHSGRVYDRDVRFEADVLLLCELYSRNLVRGSSAGSSCLEAVFSDSDSIVEGNKGNGRDLPRAVVGELLVT